MGVGRLLDGCPPWLPRGRVIPRGQEGTGWLGPAGGVEVGMRSSSVDPELGAGCTCWMEGVGLGMIKLLLPMQSGLSLLGWDAG